MTIDQLLIGDIECPFLPTPTLPLPANGATGIIYILPLLMCHTIPELIELGDSVISR
jgi:hypothetical protein